MAKIVRHAAKGSGKITSGQNPLTGATVKHSAKRWGQINSQYQKTYGPLNLTGPMSPFDVKTSIDAATHQKFDPQYQTLGKQTSASQQQDKNLTDWYAQYRQQLDAATQRSQAAQQSAQNFTQGFADSSSNLDAQQRQKLQADNQASAAQRGATVDPNQAQVGQQADQSRRQALGQFGALQAQTGADTTAYMADKSRIASGSELQAHGAEATRRQGISELVRQLQGQEGDYRTTLRGQLQQSERQNNLANATFGNTVARTENAAAAAGQTAAQRRAAAQETARHNRATEHNAAANRQAANQRAAAQREAAARRKSSSGGGSGGSGGGKKKGSGGQTQAQARTYNTAYNNVYNYVFNHPPGALRSRDQIIAGARKATGAAYGPAYAAVLAILKRYPQGWNGGTRKLT